MENFKIITSERGIELIPLNSNKYSFVRQRRNGLMEWECSNKNSSASILMMVEKCFLRASNGLPLPWMQYNIIIILNDKLKDKCFFLKKKIVRKKLKKIHLHGNALNCTYNHLVFDFFISLNKTISLLKHTQNNDCSFKAVRFDFVHETDERLYIATDQKYNFVKF